MQNYQTMTGNETHKRDLNIRLDEIGWALFLVMIGSLWLIPSQSIPSEAWLIGAGLIIIGINFTRYFMGIKMSGFTVFLGFVALIAGLSGALNLNLPVLAGAFIILGLSLLMRALFKR